MEMLKECYYVHIMAAHISIHIQSVDALMDELMVPRMVQLTVLWMVHDSAI